MDLSLVVIATQSESLTGGALQMQGSRRLVIGPIDLTSTMSFYLAALAVLLACLFIARVIWASRLGLSLRAVSVDPRGARAAGLNPFRLKLRVFVLSSAMAGLAGALWAFYFLGDPSSWGISLTLDLVTFVIVGGMSTVYGGVVGVVSVESLRYLLDRGSTDVTAQNAEPVLLSGVLLILFSLLVRNGLAPALAAAAERLDSRLAPLAWRTKPRRAPGDSPRDPMAVGRGLLTVSGAAHEIVLSVRDLSKSYGALEAAKGVSFDIRAGEVCALIGSTARGSRR